MTLGHYSKKKNLLIQGKAAIDPVGSPLEAEAEALRIAILQMENLGFSPVTFCGDSALLKKQLAQYQTFPTGMQPMSSSLSGLHRRNQKTR